MESSRFSPKWKLLPLRINCHKSLTDNDLRKLIRKWADDLTEAARKEGYSRRAEIENETSRLLGAPGSNATAAPFTTSGLV